MGVRQTLAAVQNIVGQDGLTQTQKSAQVKGLLARDPDAARLIAVASGATEAQAEGVGRGFGRAGSTTYEDSGQTRNLHPPPSPHITSADNRIKAPAKAGAFSFETAETAIKYALKAKFGVKGAEFWAEVSPEVRDRAIKKIASGGSINEETAELYRAFGKTNPDIRQRGNRYVRLDNAFTDAPKYLNTAQETEAGGGLPQQAPPGSRGKRKLEDIEGAAWLSGETGSAHSLTLDEILALPEHPQALNKGFKGIRISPNGGLIFEGSDYLYDGPGNQKNVARIKLNGGYGRDFRDANMIAKIPVESRLHAPDGYVWHHRDDFDRKTGHATLELVREDVHNAMRPHTGSVDQHKVANKGVKYRSW